MFFCFVFQISCVLFSAFPTDLRTCNRLRGKKAACVAVYHKTSRGFPLQNCRGWRGLFRERNFKVSKQSPSTWGQEEARVYINWCKTTEVKQHKLCVILGNRRARFEDCETGHKSSRPQLLSINIIIHGVRKTQLPCLSRSAITCHLTRHSASAGFFPFHCSIA